MFKLNFIKFQQKDFILQFVYENIQLIYGRQSVLTYQKCPTCTIYTQTYIISLIII